MLTGRYAPPIGPVRRLVAGFAVNLRAHFLICQAAMPILPDGAAIVFISSLAGAKPLSRVPSYEASKAALLSFTLLVIVSTGGHLCPF